MTRSERLNAQLAHEMNQPARATGVADPATEFNAAARFRRRQIVLRQVEAYSERLGSLARTGRQKPPDDSNPASGGDRPAAAKDGRNGVVAGLFP